LDTGARAADHEAFGVVVVQDDLVGREQAVHQVAVAQVVVADREHHVRVGGVVGLGEHLEAPENLFGGVFAADRWGAPNRDADRVCRPSWAGCR
jgi:hypothetical protein